MSIENENIKRRRKIGEEERGEKREEEGGREWRGREERGERGGRISTVINNFKMTLPLLTLQRRI